MDLQKAAIARHADEHGLQIVASYEDAGRSGMHIKNRDGMKRLLADVTAPDCAFGTVLVYDVSRWGRFQDTDASAYHEYHCRLHEVQVVYVAEAIGTEVGPIPALFKNLKRAMAAECSRELAVRVRAGQERVIDMGYSAGGQPAIGLVRQAVSKDGEPRLTLPRGPRKGIQSDRVKLVAGPPGEVALLRRIFRLDAEPGATVNDLVRVLAAEGHRTPAGKPFTRTVLDHLLTYEPFIGNYVSDKLTQTANGQRPTPAAKQVRKHGIIEPVIDRETWEKVQAKLARRSRVLRGRAQLLADLVRALQEKPDLTGPDLPMLGCAPAATYANAFGSMEAAYAAAGRAPHSLMTAQRARTQKTLETLRAVQAAFGGALEARGAEVRQDFLRNVTTVEGRLRVQVQLALVRTGTVDRTWFVRRTRPVAGDYRLVVRLGGDEADDYFSVPEGHRRTCPSLMNDSRPQRFMGFRVTSLASIARRLAAQVGATLADRSASLQQRRSTPRSGSNGLLTGVV